MHQQNCLTNAELKSLLTANPPAESCRFLKHLDICSKCQNRVAILAGDSTWIEDLKLKQHSPGNDDQMGEANHETELANVMERMSAKTNTAHTAASGATGLSFQGLPYTQQLVAGKRIGPYEILSRLGAGGMSVVFTARDHVLDRQVAIKFLSSELENSQTARQRFLREAKSAAAVEHDYIVPIYSADEVDGFPFLVMSLIEGQSLQQRIDESHPIPVEKVIHTGIQIAKGLAAFHTRNLVHRDLKPSNILLQAPDERVRITDFGLAKCTDDSQLTKSGTILGTPNYMSPEQALGQQVDYRSDIYGLGAVLYASITRRAPFEAPTSLKILDQLRNQTPNSILNLKPETPHWLVEVIEKLMARDPNDRYQNATEIIEALSSPSQQLITNQFGSWKTKRLTLVASCIAVLAIIVSYLTWSGIGSGRNQAEVIPEPLPVDRNNQEFVPQIKQSDFRVTVKQSGSEPLEYPTLSDAVRDADDGDIIEIEGDGTQEISSTITTNGKRLTIRAAAGSEPILTISSVKVPSGIVSDNELVLEGLTIRFNAASEPALARTPKREAVRCVSGSIRISNCRFDATIGSQDSLNCVTVIKASLCEIRNSEFYSGPLNAALDIGMIPETEFILENNVIAGAVAVSIAFPISKVAGFEATARLKRNTICAITGLLVSLPPEELGPIPPVPVEAESNLLDVDFVACLVMQSLKSTLVRPPLNPALIAQLMRWQGNANQFRVRESYIGLSLPRQKNKTARSFATLAAWNSLWKQPDSTAIQLANHSQASLLFRRDSNLVSPSNFLALSPREQSLATRRQAGAQLEFVGPGIEYTNWLLEQTSAK